MYLEIIGLKVEVRIFELFLFILLEVFIDLEIGIGYGRWGFDSGFDWGKVWCIVLNVKNGLFSVFNGNWCFDVMEWNDGNVVGNLGMGMLNGRYGEKWGVILWNREFGYEEKLYDVLGKLRGG